MTIELPINLLSNLNTILKNKKTKINDIEDKYKNILKEKRIKKLNNQQYINTLKESIFLENKNIKENIIILKNLKENLSYLNNNKFYFTYDYYFLNYLYENIKYILLNFSKNKSILYIIKYVNVDSSKNIKNFLNNYKDIFEELKYIYQTFKNNNENLKLEIKNKYNSYITTTDINKINYNKFKNLHQYSNLNVKYINKIKDIINKNKIKKMNKNVVENTYKKYYILIVFLRLNGEMIWKLYNYFKKMNFNKLIRLKLLKKSDKDFIERVENLLNSQNQYNFNVFMTIQNKSETQYYKKLFLSYLNNNSFLYKIIDTDCFINLYYDFKLNFKFLVENNNYMVIKKEIIKYNDYQNNNLFSNFKNFKDFKFLFSKENEYKNKQISNYYDKINIEFKLENFYKINSKFIISKKNKKIKKNLNNNKDHKEILDKYKLNTTFIKNKKKFLFNMTNLKNDDLDGNKKLNFKINTIDKLMKTEYNNLKKIKKKKYNQHHLKNLSIPKRIIKKKYNFGDNISKFDITKKYFKEDLDLSFHIIKNKAKPSKLNNSFDNVNCFISTKRDNKNNFIKKCLNQNKFFN